MKRIARAIVSLLLCATGSIVFAQAKPATATAKSSPASDALNAAAKELATEQVAYNTALNNARSTLDTSSKDLQKQIADLNKSLNDQIHADKKYKPMLDQIDALSKQLQNATQEAQKKFSDATGPIQQTINSDTALVSGLVPVVRKENDWPATATYDQATQTWKGTEAAKK